MCSPHASGLHRVLRVGALSSDALVYLGDLFSVPAEVFLSLIPNNYVLETRALEALTSFF
jgi:hypothetical protein